jgi:hypothetical protein
MIGIQGGLRVGIFGCLDATLGWSVIMVTGYSPLVPIPVMARWMAIIGGIHGAAIELYGWAYWTALGIDAADLLRSAMPCPRRFAS